MLWLHFVADTRERRGAGGFRPSSRLSPEPRGTSPREWSTSRAAGTSSFPRLVCWAELSVKTQVGSTPHPWDTFPVGLLPPWGSLLMEGGTSVLPQVLSANTSCLHPETVGNRAAPAPHQSPRATSGLFCPWQHHAGTHIRPCHSSARTPWVSLPSGPPFLWEFVFRTFGGTIHRSMLLVSGTSCGR